MIIGSKKKLLKKRIKKKNHENQYIVFRERALLDISGSLMQYFRIFKNIQKYQNNHISGHFLANIL